MIDIYVICYDEYDLLLKVYLNEVDVRNRIEKMFKDLKRKNSNLENKELITLLAKRYLFDNKYFSWHLCDHFEYIF